MKSNEKSRKPRDTDMEVKSARLNGRYRKPRLRFKPNELTESIHVCTSTPHCRDQILLVFKYKRSIGQQDAHGRTY